MNGLIVDLFAGGGERPAYPLLKACFAGLQSYPQTVEMTCTT